MTFRLAGDGPVRLRAVDGSDGLMELPGFVTPPANVDIARTPQRLAPLGADPGLIDVVE